MHEAQVTRAGDTPAYAGVLHQDGRYSEVRVETNERDELIVTVMKADGVHLRLSLEAQ